MNTRKPAVAGQFYPGDRKALIEMLRELFSSVDKDDLPVNNNINALVSPHAGYVFSGRQAAKAYRYLKNRRYKLVCIISPSHREYFPGISIYPGDAYKTPLGLCPVDIKAREVALSLDGVVSGSEGHKTEHALEVQLPFIQNILGDIPILPMVMGDQSQVFIDKAAECIKKLYGTYHEDILFIASSDLSHFHSAEVAKKMDSEFISLLDRAATEKIYDKLSNEELEACGGGPILAIMKGLKITEQEVKVLGYSHSGEILNDNDSVVGYTSAIMIKENQ